MIYNNLHINHYDIMQMLLKIRKDIKAPKYLCLSNENYYKNTLSFVDSIVKSANNDYLVFISFQGCTLLTPAAALLIFSTINSIQLTYNFERIIIEELSIGNKLTYDAMFSNSGIWDALNCKSIDDIHNLINKNNRFKTSCDPSIIKNVESILKKIPELTPEHIFFLTLAMKEALLNVVYHAYIDEENTSAIQVMGTRWWQCAWVNTRDKIVNIIIHDRGVGILGSYQKDGYSDEEMLKEAMQQGFSRSGLANRGMGSEDMKSPVNELYGFQSLTVFTDKYVYDYQFSSMEPKIDKREMSICGTLVYWQCSYGGKKTHGH